MLKHMERKILIGLTIFLCLTSIVGGLALLFDWTDMSVDLLEGSPFTSYTIPALILMLIVGGSAMVATLALLGEHPLALALSSLAGGLIIVFEIVEALIVGFHWLQLVYLGVGLALIALAAWVWRSERQHELALHANTMR